MSVEQWAVLGLFFLLPLPQGLARVGEGVSVIIGSSDRVGSGAAGSTTWRHPLSNRHVERQCDGSSGKHMERGHFLRRRRCRSRPRTLAMCPLAPLRASQTPVSSKGSGSL